MLMSADTNEDEVLDADEWEAFVSSSEAEVTQMASSAVTSDDGGLVAPASYNFPELEMDGIEALVAAGIVLGRKGLFNLGKQIALRRRFVVLDVVIAIAAVVVMSAIIFHEIENAKKAIWKGCYVDDHHRDLDAKIIGRSYNKAECDWHCKGYGYFALQDRDWCVCGHSYSTQKKYKKVADSECDVYGYRKGGPWRNAVWSRELKF